MLSLILHSFFSSGFSSHYPEGTIVTGGLSKGHSAGGYRLGFVAVPQNMKSVIKCLMSMVSETFSAVSSPIQAAAITAFLWQSGRNCLYTKMHSYS